MKTIRLVDGGQKSSSFSSNLLAKLMKLYLGGVDRMIRMWVEGKRNETASDYQELFSLEDNWSSIRVEVDSILNQLESVVYYEDVDKRYSRDHGNEKTQSKDFWQVEQFYLYGHPIQRGFERSPVTGELLKKIPSIQTALFSVLKPGAHIKAHCGEYAGLLRCHLGLKIDDPKACRLRVRDKVRNWEEGKIFIFDHTHEHEAWNDSDSIRVILILDFVRKLPFPLSLLNKVALKVIGRSRHIREAKGIFEKGSFV